METLRAFGIEPSGFAAPHGRFNRGLLSALDELGVRHSSEFGLAYDDLPFVPYGSSVLQIPVHPVSLGIFLEAVAAEGPRRASATRQAVRTAVDYFRETTRSKYRAGEPVFFYGHPTGRLGRYPEVLRAVFETADSFGAIWRTTLSEFVAWWHYRAAVDLRVVRHGESVLVSTDRPAERYPLGVEYWRGRHVARMRLDGQVLRFLPSALAYENRGPRPAVRPVRIDRPEGLRGWFRRLIDWERETPVKEIAKGSVRNWAKRTMRRLRP
jgi:hypothetical protein